MNPNAMAHPLVQEFVSTVGSRLARELDKVEELMQEIDPIARVELDEFYFRAFVDFFAGEEKLMYFGEGEAARKLALRTWKNVAGDELHEVDVYRMNGMKKEILFTVPPLMDRELIKTTDAEPGRPSIYGAVLNADHLSNFNRNQGQQYLMNYLGERIDRMHNPQVMLKNAKAWNKIFAFYGLKPLVPAIAAEKDQKSNGDIAQDEVVGFDPL